MIKKASIILIIISALIIFLGFSIAKNTGDEVTNKNTTSNNIYIDGTDITSATDTFTEIGTGLLGIVIFIYSFLLVGAIWVIFGIIVLIIFIIRKIRNRNNKNNI